MIHILARITVKPEHAAAARDILLALVGESRKEAGNRSYRLYRQADATHVFQTVEEWNDQAAADGHMSTPHVAAAIAAAGAMFALPPEILRYELLT